MSDVPVGMTLGDLRLLEGRPAQCDPGVTAVVSYVPPGWTLDQVLDEIRLFGSLTGVVAEGGQWVTHVCPGGDECVCQYTLLAADYRERRNGAIVYGPDDEVNP